MRVRERQFRAILRDVIDEHPPAAAVGLLRGLFDDLDQKDLAARIAAIPPAPSLPPR